MDAPPNRLVLIILIASSLSTVSFGSRTKWITERRILAGRDSAHYYTYLIEETRNGDDGPRATRVFLTRHLLSDNKEAARLRLLTSWTWGYLSQFLDEQPSMFPEAGRPLGLDAALDAGPSELEEFYARFAPEDCLEYTGDEEIARFDLASYLADARVAFRWNGMLMNKGSDRVVIKSEVELAASNAQLAEFLVTRPREDCLPQLVRAFFSDSHVFIVVQFGYQGKRGQPWNIQDGWNGISLNVNTTYQSVVVLSFDDLSRAARSLDDAARGD